MAIPKIIHQIWLGPDPLADDYVPLMEKVRAMHPGWDYRLWTDETPLAKTVRSEWRHRLRSPVERSDLLRLELLYAFGGIYLDPDFDLQKPLDPLLDLAPVVLCELSDGRVNSAFMAAVPGQATIKSMIDEARPREVFGRDPAATGALLVDRIARAPGNAGDVVVLPTASFFNLVPSHESYATHPAAGSLHGATQRKEAALRIADELAAAERRAADLEALLKATPDFVEQLQLKRLEVKALEEELAALTPRQ